MQRKPVIYFAGKISKRDWRDEVVAGHGHELDGGDNEHLLFDARHHVDCGYYCYGGPFYVRCDHGCGHGPANHGCGAAEAVCIWPDGRSIQRRVFDVNRQRIANADAVFAYINEVDCLGTLVEVGMATALGKQVVVALGPDLTFRQTDELWVARHCASGLLYVGWPVSRAWTAYYNMLADRRRPVRA
jgi:hypothetical protein